ncbi:MAG: MFS transporter [Bacillota bacterium]
MDYKNILNRNFPALTHRDFRIFWCGQCISLIGSWMQTVGQSWLVYQLTNSSLLLGIVGAFIDRHSKKKILFTVQFLMMVNAFVLSILVWNGWAKYWNIALIAFILGILNSIDMPVRQSFVVSLASKEHLINAISLNSTIFNAARIIGPAIAGIVFGTLGAAVCFLINGVSFIPVLIGIWFIKADGKRTRIKDNNRLVNEIAEGIKYILSKPIIYTVMLMVGCINMIIINSNVTVPVLTKTVLNGDSKMYGYLVTALGTGAFLGAFTLAATSFKGIRLKRHFGAVLSLALLVFIIGFQSDFYIIFALLTVTGFCLTTSLSSSNSTVQLNSPDHMRGRIMSVYTLVNGISITVGNIYSGTMCQELGVSNTYKINGALGFMIVATLLIINYKAVKAAVAERQKLEVQNA